MNITKTGMFSIVGRPNAGKSTLTNALVGEKIAIVSNKPQTTRNRITGVVNRGEAQMIFLDTPGLHKAKNRLGDYMVDIINETVAEVDAVILIVEPVARIGVPEQILIDKIKGYQLPAILVINKCDTVEQDDILPVIATYSEAHEFDAIIPISARNKKNLDVLLDELDKMCMESPQLYPDGMVTDQSEHQMFAEIIREKILLNLGDEIPHGVAIEIEREEIRENGTRAINAAITCEKKSHKGIILGKQGSKIKKIGTDAREEISKKTGSRVYLELWVKVKEDWRNNPNSVKSFGYEM
ncbi:MAG: GTPase Era [Clostridia bacterium]|nr:GTPase Era [Clostridia bacterium]MBQ6868216.1 GTPase Era [Clostridia bacterium]MBQ6934549.1 GTPase Era [Clostridia bacterium]MBQ7094352.1 GTPase Era [Clostridia bacterium]